RALHAAGRNLKGFDEESADDEEEDQRHAQGAHPIVEPASETRAAGWRRRGERHGGDGTRRAPGARVKPRGPQVMHGFYFSQAVSQAQQSPPIRGPRPNAESGVGNRRGGPDAGLGRPDMPRRPPAPPGPTPPGRPPVRRTPSARAESRPLRARSPAIRDPPDAR